MAEKGLPISYHLAMKKILLIILLLATSCATPKIIVLKDPLSAQEHNDLGLAYEQKRMYEPAEKEYKKAIEKKKDWTIPQFNLGNLYYEQGHLKKAEECYRTALRLDKDNADVMNNLANLLYDENRKTEAMDMIVQALAIQKKEEYIGTYRRITGADKP
jgi:Tfp pilus assembly protein PilF